MSKLKNKNSNPHMKYYPVLEPSMGKKEKNYVNGCIDSGWISSGGKYVREFEKSFAKFNSVRYAAATANGTVSLHLILLALGIGKGDEVIVPNFTYVATANAVLYVGAHPVFVDCETDTFNIDPKKVEGKVTKRTRAIMVTHIFGNPCRIEDIVRIARKHKLFLVEDAAEAHGALYKGKMVGTFGVANSYSFFGNKMITTGEGGMVVTDSKTIFDSVSLLKNQGQNPKKRRYYHDVLAYNYRMTNLQAAVGLAQLERISSFLRQKRQINQWYRNFLSPLVKTGHVSFQSATTGSKPSWWITAIVLKNTSARLLAKKLRARGVDTRPFFFPMNRLPYMKQKGKFPNSDFISKNGIILPSSNSLSKKDVRYISDILYTYLKSTK